MLATGAGPASAAGVAIAGEAATVHVTGPTSRNATVHLVISNDQDTDAQVCYQVLFADGKAAAVAAEPPSIRAHYPTPVTLTLSDYSFREVSGTITATVVGGATVTQPLTISRAPTLCDIWLTIGASWALAALAAIAIFWRTKGGRWRWGWALPASSSKWSFQDSGAQNITGMGALLGTVLGASGFVSSELAGLDTAKFVGLSLVAGALVVAAPLALLGTPTRRSFLAASAITLWAAFLELATLAQVLRYAHAGLGEGVFLGALIGFGAVMVFVYGVLTGQRTIRGDRPSHLL
ncbi:MAG: hypothetical protein ACJ74U_18795 [Jatrophihabitantaceae bacterium]